MDATTAVEASGARLCTLQFSIFILQFPLTALVSASRQSAGGFPYFHPEKVCLWA
jgi:hypothetical protein